MSDKQAILKQCTVTGTTVFLPPGQLDRKLYQEVAKSLELIGGKWKGGKVMGFVFQEDPSDLLEEIASGEKRNLQKEYQFFATPDDLAREMVNMATIYQGNAVLEPSAGQGAIIKAINQNMESIVVDYYELMDLNRTILEKKIDSGELKAQYVGTDFLVPKNPTYLYDRIIANPPFSKNQDIDHIYQMYKFLAPGGRIVTIASKHWEMSNNKKEREFREWLEIMEAEVYPTGEGRFKASGTTIDANILVIDKLLL